MRRLPLLLALSGCLPAEIDYTVTIHGEAFIEDRIPADEFIDGWEVTFDHFIVSVGEISFDGTPLRDIGSGYTLIDLARPTGEPFVLGESTALENPTFRYVIGPDSSPSWLNIDSKYSHVFATGKVSIFVRGLATRGSDVRNFEWAFGTRTEHTCELGPAREAVITIHGDHLFYDDLVSDSPNVAFDLIAGAPDADGLLVESDLRAVDITTLERYQVGDLTDITDLWQFIEQQATTLGHINGEGHCETVRIQ